MAVAQARFTCMGGPLDGLIVARTKPPPEFSFIDGTGRAYQEKRKTAFLYRLRGDGKLYHAEFTHCRCKGCGVWHQKGRRQTRCTLCGGQLVAV